MTSPLSIRVDLYQHLAQRSAALWGNAHVYGRGLDIHAIGHNFKFPEEVHCMRARAYGARSAAALSVHVTEDASSR